VKRLPAFALCLVTACASPGGRYSGTVQTEFSSVGSQLGGRVVEVDVQAGSRVRKGDVLVRLDSGILGAELNEARAQTASAVANLDALKNGPVQTDVARAQRASFAAQAQYAQAASGAPARVDAARAAIAAATADERLARTTYERNRALVQTGDVSRQVYDQAKSSYEQAVARSREAQAQYAQLVAEVPQQTRGALESARSARAAYRTLANGTRPEDIAQGEAQLRNARAALARAQARFDEMVIRTPVDGIVSSFSLHKGDMLAANQTAAICDSFADPYVYIYVSQRDLERIRTAKHLTIRADSGSGTFDGRVEMYDRAAQFTPQNVETADQRSDLVYGMKVRISDPTHALLDGTTVTVTVP
jgi:HlyD family secretion protein